MISRVITFTIIALFFLEASSLSYADEIRLKNKDRVTGKIIEQTEEAISVQTDAMGIISIKRSAIGNIVTSKAGPPKEAPVKPPPKEQIPEKDKQIVWKRDIALGYNNVTGNTRESQFSGSFLINRNNVYVDEWTLTGNIYYSSNKRKMDSQKWFVSGRYAYSFGRTRRWYNFYKMEADHDRFADIGHRLVPSAGIGYWLYDTCDFKLLAETAIGFEHTEYRTDLKDGDKWVLIPRVFFEKRLFSNTTLTQDIYYYPELKKFGDCRLRSATSLNIGMNDKLSIKISLIDDYNSIPPKGVKDNDLRLISALAYSF